MTYTTIGAAWFVASIVGAMWSARRLRKGESEHGFGIAAWALSAVLGLSLATFDFSQL